MPDAYWRFRAGFEEALDPQFYPALHLDWLVGTGQAFFWHSEDAAIVAEIKDYPGGARVIHGLVATGDLEQIVNHLIPVAEAWGKSQGCTHAIIESRAGWARALKPHGYEPHQVALRKSL